MFCLPERGLSLFQKTVLAPEIKDFCRKKSLDLLIHTPAGPDPFSKKATHLLWQTRNEPKDIMSLMSLAPRSPWLNGVHSFPKSLQTSAGGCFGSPPNQRKTTTFGFGTPHSAGLTHFTHILEPLNAFSSHGASIM